MVTFKALKLALVGFADIVNQDKTAQNGMSGLRSALAATLPDIVTKVGLNLKYMDLRILLAMIVQAIYLTLYGLRDFMTIFCEKFDSHYFSFVSNYISESRRSPTDTLFSLPLQKYQIEELIKIIGRRTKCQIVEHLMAEFGIHSMVLTSFLSSEKFFNFDSEYGSWISKHEIDKLDTAETILSESEAKIKHLVNGIVDYVSDQYEHLEEIQKQQFELYGILRQSVFDVKVKLQTRLTTELQDEILSLHEVTGCGTIFGILTLHVSKELAQPSKDSLKQLLRIYNYYRRYRVHVVSMQKKQHIQSGSAMQAEIKDDLKEPSKECKHGTIGCFVNVEETVSEDGAERTSDTIDTQVSNANYETNIVLRKQIFCTDESGDHRTSKNGQSPNGRRSRETLKATNISNGLHCITCRHCVSNCKDEVVVDGQRNFAVQTSYFIEQGEKFDIALLRICEDRKRDCNLKLPGGNATDDLYPWQIFDNSSKLDERPVYKYGCNTQCTYGVIASNNYKEVNKFKSVCNIHALDRDKRNCMDPNVTVIIAGSESPFSDGGDSGAVICDRNINKNVVTVIGILHGALYENGKWLCSYGARLRSSFDELGRRFGIVIQPPGFDEDPFPPP